MSMKDAMLAYIKETRYYFAHTSTLVCFNEMVRSIIYEIGAYGSI